MKLGCFVNLFLKAINAGVVAYRVQVAVVGTRGQHGEAVLLSICDKYAKLLEIEVFVTRSNSV
jgi:hypothetical protein